MKLVVAPKLQACNEMALLDMAVGPGATLNGHGRTGFSVKWECPKRVSLSFTNHTFSNISIATYFA